MTVLFTAYLFEGDGGGQALSRILRLSPVLADFRFSATRAGRLGSGAIASALGSCPLLARLDLSDNTFGPEGGQALALALPGLGALRQLNLRDTSELRRAHCFTAVI